MFGFSRKRKDKPVPSAFVNRESPSYEDARQYDALLSGSRYTTPSLESGSPYVPNTGYSPALRTGPNEYPDARRVEAIPLYDFRPDAAQAPERFWDRIDRDDANRHVVEKVQSFGRVKESAGSGKSRAADPRWNPPTPSRVSDTLSPAQYSFTRPFDQHSARKLNGSHFSMADNMRTFDILGMAPAHRARNTYRIDPQPWDDELAERAARPSTAPVLSPAASGSRSHRLV